MGANRTVGHTPGVLTPGQSAQDPQKPAAVDEPVAPPDPAAAPPKPEAAPGGDAPGGAATGGAATGRQAVRRRLHVARHAVLTWRRRPAGRYATAALLMLAMVVVGGAAGGFGIPLAGRIAGPYPSHSHDPWPSYSPRPTLSPPLGGVRPSEGAGAGAGSGRPADALADWAGQVSGRTGIPAVALQAYGYAELVLANTTPGCQLRWTTLAGIGKAESDHGRAHATLNADGKVSPPIIGPALTGTGSVRAVPDTDGGKLDGDPTWDHAVGPMQFIPATWTQYAVDADRDGVADPQDIDDAALAAARYLCAGDRNLAEPGGWWAAVLAYNTVQQYANEVFDAAEDYDKRSK